MYKSKASQNKILDDKSLIKKYQKEISCLKQELQQLKYGKTETNQLDMVNLKLQLEAGQIKLQSRLEEEEQAKAALLGRIQRLTKLILVSTKNTVPSTIAKNPGYRRSYSICEDEKPDKSVGSSISSESESFVSGSPVSFSRLGESRVKYTETKDGTGKSISMLGDDTSILESFPGRKEADDLFSSTGGRRLLRPPVSTVVDQMDLLYEQVKLLAGEMAFCNSSLKRLSEAAASKPYDSQLQALSKLATQLNEKTFELEIKLADNRILQEQLQMKVSENAELQQTILLLRRELDSFVLAKSPSYPSQPIENGVTAHKPWFESSVKTRWDDQDKFCVHGEICFDESTPTCVVNSNIMLFQEELNESGGCVQLDDSIRKPDFNFAWDELNQKVIIEYEREAALETALHEQEKN